MEGQISEDYFTRDFPYYKLKGLDEKEILSINKELENIKNMTKNVDISKCFLTENIYNYRDFFNNKYKIFIIPDIVSIPDIIFNITSILNISSILNITYKEAAICTAFYLPEDIITKKLSISCYDYSRVRKVKIKDGISNVLNNIYSSPNENISLILKLSKEFDYIRDITDNNIHNNHIHNNNIHKNNHLEEILYRRDFLNEFERNPLSNNPINFYYSPGIDDVCQQAKKREIFHKFGDREIIIDGEKYIRCDIIRPFCSSSEVKMKSEKMYREWLIIEPNYIMPKIRWIRDEIINFLY